MVAARPPEKYRYKMITRSTIMNKMKITDKDIEEYYATAQMPTRRTYHTGTAPKKPKGKADPDPGGRRRLQVNG